MRGMHLSLYSTLLYRAIVSRIGLSDVRSWVHLRAHTVQASQQRRGALMHRSASEVFVLRRDTNKWS